MSTRSQPTSRVLVRALVATAALASAILTIDTASVAAQEAFGISAVHFVVDVSGSMSETDDNGKIRINGAKEALAAMLTSLDDDVAIGLRSYPSGGGCDVHPAPDADFRTAREEIGATVRLLQPNGETPTAEALRAAGADLRAAGHARRGVIVLISDGESNCTGDPCAVAEQLGAEYGIDVTVNTVGFQISAAGRDELECIARATGGVYVDAADADELADSLQSVAAASLSLSVDAPEVLIRSVGVGETLDQSPEIEIRATVRNTSANVAGNVRATITVTSQRRPFILRPVRTPGNLEPSDSIDVVWTFTPPLDFTDVDITLTIAVSAINAPPVERDITVALRGSIRLDDAGDLLQDRDHVVIVGDSYSAGEGTRNYLPGTDVDGNPCHRSNQTYGADLWPDTRTVIACSGATTHNLYTAQHTDVDPQLEQLRELHAQRPADLVLMTLGGNDTEFAKLIRTCVMVDCDDARVVAETACTASAYRADDTNRFLAPNTGCLTAQSTLSAHHDALLVDVVPRLTRAYRDIDTIVNPDGGQDVPIVVLAYPSPVPDGRRFNEVVRACTANLSLDYNEWKYATEFASRLNAAVNTAVQQARRDGVPVYFVENSTDAFEPSHTVCDADPYINPLDVAATSAMVAGFIARLTATLANYMTPLEVPRVVQLGSATPAEREMQASFHPNANGYRAMTAALLEWSNTPAALEPPPPRSRSRLTVELAEPSNLTWSAAEEPPDLKVGTSATLTVRDLHVTQPGAPATVIVNSTLTRLGDSYVDDSGTAVFHVNIPTNLEAGAHTLTLMSIGDDGNPYTRVWTVDITTETTRWEQWSLIAAGAAATAAAVGAILTFTLFALRRRSNRPARLG